MEKVDNRASIDPTLNDDVPVPRKGLSKVS